MVQKRVPYTDEETDAILKGYEKYKHDHTQPWIKIKNDPEFSGVLQNRTNVQIKDKVRTILEKKRIKDTARAIERIQITKWIPPKKEKTNTINRVPSTSASRLKATKQPTKVEWSETQKNVVWECLRSHGNHKPMEFLCDKIINYRPKDLMGKSLMDIKDFITTQKRFPTDDPIRICMSCRKYTQAYKEDPVVVLPCVGVGKDAEKYMTTCSACQRASAVVLLAFFSPMSGSDLETQKDFLKKLHRSQRTPSEASKAIHMDHIKEYKADSMSDLAKDPNLTKFFQEWIQAGCVAIHGMDHTWISDDDNWDPNGNKEDRIRVLKFLRERRKTIETDSLEKEVIGELGKSMCSFMSSPLFWREDRPLEDCLAALDDRWQEILNRAETSPVLRWFIQLGHARVGRVLFRVADDRRPEDFKQIEKLLENWNVVGPPFPLVSLDIQSNVYAGDDEEPGKDVAVIPPSVEKENAERDSESDESDNESAVYRERATREWLHFEIDSSDSESDDV